MNHDATPTGHGLPLARRRSLVLALAGSAALAALPAGAQPAAGKGDILIGRSTALTGGMAPFLAPLHEGQEAAIADANAKGVSAAARSGWCRWTTGSTRAVGWKTPNS